MDLNEVLQQKAELDKAFIGLSECLKMAQEEFQKKHETLLQALEGNQKMHAQSLAEIQKALEKILTPQQPQ